VDVVAAGEGLDTDVEADVAAGLGVGLFSLAAGSQAAISKHRASTARSFVVMFFAPVILTLSVFRLFNGRILNSRVNDDGRRNVTG
jgi:hypothetical protein